jgi:hypothetical protein
LALSVTSVAETGPAGGLDDGHHGPDVVVGGVIDRGEAPDEPVVERRPRGGVLAQADQQVPDLVLEPVGEAAGATTGWMVDGPKAPITRSRSASRGWSRSSMARTWESMAAASTVPAATRRMARWW